MNKCRTLCLALLFLVGCNYHEGKKALELETKLPQKLTPPEEITYKMVNEAILQKACLKCHSAEGGNKGGINLETYENVFKNAHKIRLEVAGGTMPPSQKLSEEQIKLLTDWIDAGTAENGKVSGEAPAPAPAPPPTPTPEPEPVKITFAVVMNQVIKTNCLQCHSESSGNKGEINLERYENVFEKRLDIKFAVETNQMPTKKGTPLTNEQKKLILTWIDQGSLQ